MNSLDDIINEYCKRFKGLDDEHEFGRIVTPAMEYAIEQWKSQQPSGMRWVEIKSEADLPDGDTCCKLIPFKHPDLVYYVGISRAASGGLLENFRVYYLSESADPWQPIESAPRDGTLIVLGHPDYKSFPVAKWALVGEDEGAGYCWVSEDDNHWEDGVLYPDLGYIEPTVWMHLPKK